MPLNPTAPAQASDETLATAPPYIAFNETWDDAEWRAAAATRTGVRTEAQQYLYAGGPRPHPWGAAAFVGYLPDGRRAFFPNEQAFRDFAGEHNIEHKPAAPAADALGAINAGLAAHAPAAPGDPALEKERLASAAPAVAAGPAQVVR